MRKNNTIIYWSFWIIYLEVIYKLFILKNLFTSNTIHVLLFSMFIIYILTLLTSIFNKKINKIISIILLLVIVIVYLAQMVYYNFYYSVFSIFSLFTGMSGAFEFWTMIIEVILRIWYVFILVLVPLIFTYININNVFKFNKCYKKKIMRNIALIVLSFLLIIVDIKTDRSYYSLNKLINKTHAPMLTINKTGLFTMEVLDIYRYINGFDEKPFINKYNYKEYDKDKYNIMDISFKDSNDEELNKMNYYFNNVKPTNKNEYTGLFKNKNIIFINAESFDRIAINKDITPTLYKISNEGFVFNNYYQPLYPISTFDGEYMNLFSLIPKEGTWSLTDQSKNYNPFVLGNYMKNNGYNTYAYHDYMYNFYNRQITHKNIGFKYEACGNGIENKMNCNHFPNSDYEMIKSTINDYIDNTPFVTYYMTVSGHLTYNFKENYISKKNYDLVKDLNYSDRIKAYMGTAIEVDKALELLIKELENKNLLNDTVIVLSPDHFPYGLTKKELNEVDNITRDNKFDLYHSSLIIYNPNIEHKEIDTLCSGIDILPTLYNLLGLSYDSRLLMGRDIFSDEEHFVILSDRSWISNKGKFDSLNNTFISKYDVDENYIKTVNNIVNERMSMSSLIINKDYYNRIGINYEN